MFLSLHGRVGRSVRLMVAAAFAGGLAGCASLNDQAATTLSQAPAIGLPANAPARPAEPLPFPAVHDMPPQRAQTTLTEVEQQKMEDDLVAARTRHQAIAGTKIKANAAANAKKPKAAPPKQQPAQARASAAPPRRQAPSDATGAIY
jgi:hypothetical protein